MTKAIVQANRATTTRALTQSLRAQDKPCVQVLVIGTSKVKFMIDGDASVNILDENAFSQLDSRYITKSFILTFVSDQKGIHKK